MDDLPDALVLCILSSISNAKDVACCTCVAKRWKDSTRHLKCLCFPENLFENLTEGNTPDSIIMQMVSAISQLEELVVCCPFSSAGLASWLSVRGSTLKTLDLRMGNLVDPENNDDNLYKLDCLKAAPNLETLRLWGVLMDRSPRWGRCMKLKELEIFGARLTNDRVLENTLASCPNLTHLWLLGCEGCRSMTIELPQLEECMIEFHHKFGNYSLFLSSPKLELLEVQGCCWITVPQTQCLKTLLIGHKSGRVYYVLFGKLVALESLSISGLQWSWDTVTRMLQLATEVKRLDMKVEFTGDHNSLQAFPEIDFASFFNSHPQLEKLDMHNAMFAALCQKNSLKDVHARFVIPCLEEVAITIKSPVDAEQQISTLKSLLKYAPNLKKMTLKVLHMKSNDSNAKHFLEEIYKFSDNNPKIISIE